MRALVPHEAINLLVEDEAAEHSIAERCNFDGAENIRFHRVTTVDSWIRDYGPNFLVRESAGRRELAYNDWVFNAWGSKYEDLKRDDTIPERLESVLNVPRFEPRVVMEGGSIEVNGAGVVMTTEQCLLNPNRNPHLDRAGIEQHLKDYLGVEKVLWLGEGIVGDDTDGHIDDIARFTSPTTIVCALEEDPADENYELLQDNFRRLQEERDARGGLTVSSSFRCPAASAATTPNACPPATPTLHRQLGCPRARLRPPQNDRRAVEILQPLFPTRRVIPINCEPLVWGMGTIHCVTQQQPDV